jgi:crossover junction endodeoxyribonuclease RuvC
MVCGYGRADKQQIQRMVQAILGLDEAPHPSHAADALAVAICHALAPPLLAVSARRARPFGTRAAGSILRTPPPR